MQISRLLLISAVFAQICTQAVRAHDHLNAGVIGTGGGGIAQLGDQLFWHNGTEYDVSSPYSLVLEYNAGGNTFGADGFQFDGNITMTSLHDYDEGGALPGSYLQVRLLEVSGPVGATLAWYENGGMDPTFTAASGSAGLSYQFNLTSGVFPRDAAADPFGHVHGRRWAVNMAGEYTLTFLLTDASGQHVDSAPYSMRLTAVPEPGVGVLLAGGLMALTGGRRRWQRRLPRRGLVA